MENHNNRRNRLAWKALIPLTGVGALLMWGQTASSPISQGVSGRAPLPEHSIVRSIVPTGDGIWFVTQDPGPTSPAWAIYSWNPAGVQHVPVDCPERSSGVPQLVLDGAGDPWLLTSCGVFHHDGSAFQRRPEFDALQPKGLEGGAFPWLITADNQVLYLPGWDAAAAQARQVPVRGDVSHWAADSTGSLYFSVLGTSGDRLFVASPYSLSVQEITTQAGTFQRITAMYAGSWSDLWISQTDGQLLRYFGNSWASYSSAVPPLRLMSEDSDGNLYLAPEAAGSAADTAYLMIPQGLRLQPQGAPQHFRLDRFRGLIRSIASDATGGTWMGMDGGAARIRGGSAEPWISNSKRTRRPQSLPAAMAASPLPLAANSVPSFPGGKFSVYSAARGLVGNQVSSITEDGSGNVYFTTGYRNVAFSGGDVAGNGVSRWDHRAFISLTTVNGLASNTVQASTYDPATGMVWFGTDQGVSRYNPTTNTFTTFLSSQNVKALRVVPGGFIFAGTWGGGLFKLNAGTGATISQFTRANTGGSGNIGGNWLVSDQITSLALEDNGNVLWVGTDRGAPVGGSNDHQGGISRYQINTNSWTGIDLNAVGGVVQYDSNEVLDVAVDAANNLWISSGAKAVYRRSSGGVYSIFQQASGLGGNAANVVFRIYRDLANNLWFGFGGYGNVPNPATVAATFLPSTGVSAASPPFQNYNDAVNGFPSNLIIAFFSENASTMYFGLGGGGAVRLGGPSDEPGWPQLLNGYVYTSSPVLADLEGNGKLNVIVGDQAGFIYAYRPNGTLLWSYDARSAYPASMQPLGNITIQSSPSVADVDGDGYPEVVVGVNGLVGSNIGPALGPVGPGHGSLLVLSRTGTLKRVFFPHDITAMGVPLSGHDGKAEHVFVTPTLANVDDDPEPEILFASLDNMFNALNSDGSVIYSMDNDGDGQFDEDFLGDWTPWYPLDYANQSLAICPGVCGIDDDRNGEIDEGNGTDDDEDGLMDEDWSEFPFLLADSSLSSPVVYDLFGAGKQNIIFGQDYAAGFVGARFNRGGILNVLDNQGNVTWQKGNLEQTIMSSPSLVDLDGDGALEVVHGSGIDTSSLPPGQSALLLGQLVYAWKRDGSNFPSLSATGAPGVFAATQGQSFSSPAIGDLDGDGNPDLVYVTSIMVDRNGVPIDSAGNTLSPGQFQTSTAGQRVYAFKKDGTLLPGFPVRPFPYVANTPILGSPALADINGDGLPEIVVPAGYGLIVIDHLGHVVSGMGVWENLHDPVSQINVQSSPVIADINRDGILRAVWATGVNNNGTIQGVLRVARLGPVNAAGYQWPMFRRIAERNAVYDVVVSQPGWRAGSGSNVIFSALALKGRNPITGVTLDLSPLGGSALQPMNDAGTGGDMVANDAHYGAQFDTGPVAAGRYYLTVTATDSQGRTGRGTIIYVKRTTGKRLSVAVSNLNFGSVGQGHNKELHIGIINVGDAPTTISSVTSGNAQFYIASPTMPGGPAVNAAGAIRFPMVLQPGDGGVVSLMARVHPAFSSIGSIATTLTINSDDVAQPARIVNLQATAATVNGGIQVSKGGVNCGNSPLPPCNLTDYPTIPIGGRADHTVQIASNGTGPLMIKSIVISNPNFAVYQPYNPAFPRTYPTGSSFNFSIRFTAPSTTGTQTGMAILTTNDPGNPTIVVNLSAGVQGGCQPSLSASSANVAAFATTNGNPGAPIGSSVSIISPNCAYNATTSATWVTLGGATGTGNGTLYYIVAPNFSSNPRSATVTVGGAPFIINQAADTRPQNERFVNIMYNNFLARVPDSAGFNFYVQGLNNGTFTRDQIAAGFFNSAEFNIIERFVAGLYVGILGRDAEFVGWDYHRRNLLNGSVTQPILVHAFLNSAEYGMRYGNPSDATFVTLLFTNALQRQPSPAEVATFVAQLQSGVSRDNVAQTILNAPEFQTGAVNRLNAFLMYFTTLSRNPDAGGVAGWIQLLNSGLTVQQALAGFIGSPEFLLLLGQ